MATVTVVPSAATATVGVGTSSAGRKFLIVANDDANRLYVLLGNGTVSLTNYSFSLAQNESAGVPHYRDKVSLIWAADGSGNAYITEVE